MRLDPAGFAGRELAERAEAHFPPAAKVVTVDGTAEALADVLELLRPPQPTEILGPVPLPATSSQAPGSGSEEAIERLTLRAPLSSGAALVRAIKEVAGVRSARKSDGALRIRVDPVVL